MCVLELYGTYNHCMCLKYKKDGSSGVEVNVIVTKRDMKWTGMI